VLAQRSGNPSVLGSRYHGDEFHSSEYGTDLSQTTTGADGEGTADIPRKRRHRAPDQPLESSPMNLRPVEGYLQREVEKIVGRDECA